MATTPTTTVTREQIEAAHRVYDFTTRETYYSVESATTPGVTYKVAWNRTYGVFSCSCLSGQVGGKCWHKNAAVAAEKERLAQKAEARQEAAKQAQIDAWTAQGHDRATAERVANAKPAKSTAKGNLNGPRAFSLL